jgi:hypothetical protein
MIISDNKLLSKNDKNKIELLKMANDSVCEFVNLNDLVKLINKNIFDNPFRDKRVINILYSKIFKNCNRLYLFNEQIIENINNFDIIVLSHKNKLYNYTTIKIKIENYLKNSHSSHHIKWKLK